MPRPKLSLVMENESSPLLMPQQSVNDGDIDDVHPLSESLELQDNEDQASKSALYLFLLTLSIGGLQIVWSVELSNGSPYLLSLGMSKSLLAFVWIAGPLSGVLVQPYVGIRSDNCRISWGKRKPFMLGGGGASIVSLLALAWTREIMRGFLGIFGAAPESDGVKNASIVFAIVFTYVLDFAINTVEAGIRAFIVDNAPAHQQEDANAWASRITGVGNVLGYIFGYIDLPRIFPLFGNTQFKVLCVLASFSIGSTLLISCFFIKERDPRLEGPPSTENPGVLSFFKSIFISIRRLPPQIARVCEVQFFNWLGWFPFLFYITTYIGQLYVNPIFASHPDLSDSEIDAVWTKAARVGTFALLVYAITSFAANILLPFLVVPTYKPLSQSPSTKPASPLSIRPQSSRRLSTPRLPISASPTDLFLPTETKASPAAQAGLAGLLTHLQIPGFTLRRAWLLAHLLFALCMFSTFFIHTPFAATILTTLVGIAWSLTLWAPFALISAEVARRDALRRQKRRRALGSSASLPAEDRNGDVENLKLNGDEDSAADQAGVILGLHNVAVSSPQVIATLISSAIFKGLQKPRGSAGDESVSWVLRVSGLAALVAAWMTARISEDPGAGAVAGEDGRRKARRSDVTG